MEHQCRRDYSKHGTHRYLSHRGIFPVTDGSAEFDKMLQRLYNGIDGKIFDIDKQPDPIVYIDDLAAYNEQEGLALSPDEINYLNDLSKKSDGN